ncbi:hypothetical protein [Flavobacterium seoulense]|uniref:DUF4259 domain-containing protein n=1 Tax=Flavobacterium seoulense TaxID=1492738 RepID=A0A066WXU7_9FLAO|nr:hypothetical protein [Flavobacterium seoulense]KDN55769.1 hypothetical protein FEM21_11600 [Flavobacterium seoulense]
MGTWGTAIKDNDTFADIYSEFFEHYDKGASPQEISKKLFEDNKELINKSDDSSNFWFAIALAQWETKSLDNKVFSIVENIILTEKDLQSWRELGADEDDIKKRKTVLEKFLAKLKTKKAKAKPRKKAKNIKPIFETGDCICFKLKNGNYGGALVLSTNLDPKFGLNLIASTTINQTTKPTINDFKNADVLICSFANWKNNPKITWYFPPLPKNNPPSFEVIGKIEIEINYESKETRSNVYKFHPSFSGGWDQIIEAVNMQIEHEKANSLPKNRLKISQVTKKRKWWNIS